MIDWATCPADRSGEHDVSTAYERDWSTLKNGDLLDVAAKEINHNFR